MIFRYKKSCRSDLPMLQIMKTEMAGENERTPRSTKAAKCGQNEGHTLCAFAGN